jgi:hypothetical protein
MHGVSSIKFKKSYANVYDMILLILRCIQGFGGET